MDGPKGQRVRFNRQSSRRGEGYARKTLYSASNALFGISSPVKVGHPEFRFAAERFQLEVMPDNSTLAKR
jgi:hypothetical protein